MISVSNSKWKEKVLNDWFNTNIVKTNNNVHIKTATKLPLQIGQ